MGQVDITELLGDPDFMDPITLIHRKSVPDGFGQNQLTEQGHSTFGCIQPISGKALMRLPDEYRVANVLSFWVKGKIISDGKCQYPDVLVLNGLRYSVQTVAEWLNWGEGWCEGTCIRERPAL